MKHKTIEMSLFKSGATLLAVSLFTIFFFLSHSLSNSKSKPTPIESPQESVVVEDTKSQKKTYSRPVQHPSSVLHISATPVPEREGKLQTIRIKVDQGKSDQAIDLLKQFIEEDPSNENALMELAMVQLIDQEAPRMAQETFEKILNINPYHEMALIELLGLYEDQGNLDEGFDFLKEIYQRHTNASKIALAIGQLQAQEENTEEAITWLEKAALNHEDRPTALSLLADLWLESGQFQKSWEIFERLVEHHHESQQPDSYEQAIATRIEQLELLINLERLDEAKESLAGWIQTSPLEEQEPLSELMVILQKAQQG